MGMGLGLGLGHGHGTTGTLTPHGVATSATSPTAHSAPLGNICNTLPHAPSSSSGGGLAGNLPLNRNLVMLRNHLRKNTGSSAAGNGGTGASGVGVQLLQDQDDRLEDQ
ncbi:uncharacterized protein [Drosophila takahashii]|uniref:uncharacterized protein n=1 Tax=Drosophila takahashii TaxID=29030 RepID=UPI0007E7F14F|nr:uncharacterized protein LOC108064437 [Drosophila takahashii]